MQASFPSRSAVASMLACAALSCGFSQYVSAQIDSQTGVRSAAEIRFQERVTSRRNPLDEFKLHQSPQSSVNQVQFTAAVRPQPPAVQPPAIIAPATISSDGARQLELTDANDSVPSAGGTNQVAAGELNDGDSIAAGNKRDGLVPMQNRRLSSAVAAVNISMDGIGTGLVPTTAQVESNAPIGLPNGLARGVTFKCVHWQPTLMQHYPLYYEEAMLERHGHVRWGCLQPLASGARFFATSALAPYLRVLRPKHDCEYILGHYRAGSCAPLLHDTLPYDKHAAVTQTLASAGFFWAMPL